MASNFSLNHPIALPRQPFMEMQPIGAEGKSTPSDISNLCRTHVWFGGAGRNRTMSSPAASLNILIYKGILALILMGFKRFLTLHATYSVIEEIVEGFLLGNLTVFIGDFS
jgi:hypothetical protein